MALSEILTRRRSERIPRPATLGKHTFGSDDLVHTPARPRSDPARPDPAWLPIPAGSNWRHCSRRLQTPTPPAPDNRDFRRIPSEPPFDWRSSEGEPDDRQSNGGSEGIRRKSRLSGAGGVGV